MEASIIERTGCLSLYPHRYSVEDENEEIYSVVETNRKPIFPYSYYFQEYTASINGTTISFVPPEGADTIKSTRFSFMTPGLKVMSSYEDMIKIKWKKNLGHNVINIAELSQGTEFKSNFDNTWLDEYLQNFMPNYLRDSYRRDIGNISELTKCSKYLPQHTICFEQPWSYSRVTKNQFKLFLLDDPKTLIHRYDLNMNILDFLEMYEYNNDYDEWIPILPDPDKLIGMPSDKRFFNFTLTGKFGILSEDDKDRYFCEIDSTGDYSSQDDIMYFDDVLIINSETNILLGESDTVPLKCEDLCKSIHWVCENVTRIEGIEEPPRNSNYTDTLDGLGVDPILNSTLSYGNNNYKFYQMCNHHFQGPECREHFNCSSDEKGYNCCAFCSKPVTTEIECGCIFSGKIDGLFTVKLRSGAENNIPVNTEKVRYIKYVEPKTTIESMNRTHCLFNLKIRLLIQKEYKMIDGEIVKIKRITD